METETESISSAYSRNIVHKIKALWAKNMTHLISIPAVLDHLNKTCQNVVLLWRLDQTLNHSAWCETLEE